MPHEVGPTWNRESDEKQKARNAIWRAAHPGYMKAKCAAWRLTHERKPEKREAYKELVNWRARCKRAGVEVPPQAYWRNNKTLEGVPKRYIYLRRDHKLTREEQNAETRADYWQFRKAGLVMRHDENGKRRWVVFDPNEPKKPRRKKNAVQEPRGQANLPAPLLP